ncbi:hypothetical protein BAR24066_07383 [Burkholderia arboris]|uniref:Uncharacterized protein n=1 Tax=Burkholderia arboris TaxID=488730 RepID=A0A9Q9SRT9_9BURK|nr:hypothetical protein BAR24066_07383 [Burkholderia arboris]
MFMGKQACEPYLRIADCRAHVGRVDVDAQRQRIDIQAQRAVGAGAGRHAPEQHRPEHDVPLPARAGEDERPRQMAQRGEAHADGFRQRTQSCVERARHRSTRVVQRRHVVVLEREAERKGRRIDVIQHLAEERLVRTRGHPETRMGDEIAVGLRRGKAVYLSGEHRLDFFVQDRKRGMVSDEVMEQHRRVPASSRRLGDHEAQERGLGQIHPVTPRMDEARQLLRGALAGIVEGQLGHVDVRAPQHDLYR